MNNLGKIPPQSIDLEKAILGALLIEKDAIIDVIDLIHPDCFYKDSNANIFKSILELFQKSEPIDLLTVTDQLRKNGTLDQSGGAYYITELASNISSGSNIKKHCAIVYENYLKRQLIKTGLEATDMAFDDKSDAFEIIGKVENNLIKLSDNIKSGNVYDSFSLLPDAIDRLKKASKQSDGVTGIPSGFSEVDKITGGWQNTDLIIIAARPAQGKTDLAINIALNGAKAGFKTAFFSLEMGKEQLMNRAIAITNEIDREKLKFGNLSSEDWLKITSPNELLFKNFYIADEPTLSTISLKSKARRLKIQQKIDLIIVDYLQLMQSYEKGSTNDKVSDISRTLKLVAKELNIPVIALSQLSRSVETRGGDKRPMLSDLRDSGAIEQDADIVIFPYRPSYYGIETREDGSDCRQLMEIDFAKNRSGKVGTVDLRYLGKFGKVTHFKEDNKEFDLPNYGFKTNGITDF